MVIPLDTKGLTIGDLASHLFDVDDRLAAADQEPWSPRFHTPFSSPATDEDQRLAGLLADIDWHPSERPCGALSRDAPNPAAYLRRRGSNTCILAEGMGFEPMVTRRPQRLSRPPHSSALATFRRRG